MADVCKIRIHEKGIYSDMKDVDSKKTSSKSPQHMGNHLTEYYLWTFLDLLVMIKVLC